MKALITKPDGSTVTIKGKPDDVVEVLRELGYQATQPLPWPYTDTTGTQPWWAGLPWTCGTGSATITVSAPTISGASRAEAGRELIGLMNDGDARFRSS